MTLRQRTTDRARRQLHLEPLEERNVPAITYHGGALLPHVAVEADYVGNFWSTATAAANRGACTSFSMRLPPLARKLRRTVSP